MRRKFRRSMMIASIVAFIIVGLHGLSKAIEADVNQPYAHLSPSKAELIVDRSMFHKDAQPPCGSMQDLPSQGIPVELVGEAESEKGRLYQMWYYERDLEPITDVTIMIGEACGLAYSRFDDVITNRVPLPVARELTLQFYRSVSEAQGRQRYVEMVLDSFVVEEPRPHPYPIAQPREIPLIKIDSVQLWVWEQMGIDIPEGTYELVDIDDAWQYD